MDQKRVDRLLAALDDVEHARRDAPASASHSPMSTEAEALLDDAGLPGLVAA